MSVFDARAVIFIAVCCTASGCSALTDKHGKEDATVKTEAATATNNAVKAGAASLFDDEQPRSLDDYEYTVHWRKLMPGGAVLNTQGNVHVIAYSDPRQQESKSLSATHQRELWDDHPRPALSVKNGNLAGSSSIPTKMKRSARPPTSAHILKAYRKFCDAGNGMSDADWDVIDANRGVHGIPWELVSDCVAPK